MRERVMKVLRDYTTASFGQVHYRHAGAQVRPAVVLVHQTPSTSAMYEDLMLALANDFRLIAPDTPGMGLSDPVAGTPRIEALARGIAEFLDRLEIDRCHLFGHHTGAAIAAQLAADRPERVEKLALSGPTLLDAGLRARLPEAAATVPAEDDGAHLVKMWRRTVDKDPNASLDIVHRETIDALALGEHYPAAYDAVMAHDIEGTLATLSCPVLVFAGTADVLHGQLDAAFALLANGSKREIDGAGTYVCETHRHEVAALLRAFFIGN